MPGWISTLLLTVGSVLVTLTVTLIFNRLIGLPKEMKKQKELEKAEKEKLAKENEERDKKIAELEGAVAALPGYRNQSLQIQQQLQTADNTILVTCQQIQTAVSENQKSLSIRLDNLEKREKNAIREKLLAQYRQFVSPALNASKCWSEMEHHAFFELVRDYEDLGGNDYIHSVVLPEINNLNVISMTDLEALKKMYDMRAIGIISTQSTIQ